MKLQHAAIKFTQERNTKKLFKLLDNMKDPSILPLICDVNAVGIDGHRFAWDTLEDWQCE